MRKEHDSIYRIDLNCGSKIDRFDLTGQAEGNNGINAIRSDPTKNIVYALVAGHYDYLNSVYVVDGASDEVLSEISIPIEGINQEILVDQANNYIYASDDEFIYIIDGN